MEGIRVNMIQSMLHGIFLIDNKNIILFLNKEFYWKVFLILLHFTYDYCMYMDVHGTAGERRLSGAL